MSTKVGGPGRVAKSKEERRVIGSQGHCGKAEISMWIRSRSTSLKALISILPASAYIHLATVSPEELK